MGKQRDTLSTARRQTRTNTLSCFVTKGHSPWRGKGQLFQHVVPRNGLCMGKPQKQNHKTTLDLNLTPYPKMSRHGSQT